MKNITVIGAGTMGNGISYYYAQDNTMFGGRLFVIFKSNQKTVVAGRTVIVNLNTTYHNTEMTCPVDCPQ